MASDSDKEFSSMLPPRKQDVLVRPDAEHPMLNACLNYMHGDSRDYGYRRGYRKAAKILAEYVCETASEQDGLVFPIVHNYRHHVELVLKRLIVVGSYLIDRDLSQGAKKIRFKHRLDLLWNEAKPILFEVCKSAGWSELDNDDIEGVDSYIRQLHEVDPDSFSFRYATSKKDDPSVPSVRHLNIRVFADHMEQLASYLDSIDSAYMALKDTKDEYETEMRSQEPDWSD
jgi:hypothetical protein